ncbi:hypothetical protein YH63_012485 [Afipia massiliensis]|uniref:Uncharacterized protein n=1 Tax=Afipia massiliensis TaxID=211460 RepID=A0A4U6BQJ8_9BRAD|nr:hypothetical protein [Afipia massiliensis]TKT72171.1 hypothetical protein YH63_012485 [Afipia massiliensis]
MSESQLSPSYRSDTQSEGNKNQILKLLVPISETLYLLIKQDQRLGAKFLYKKKDFQAVAQKYFLASNDAGRSLTPENFERLFVSTAEFIDFFRQLFPHDRSRMVTTLRRNGGNSLAVIYKNSFALLKLLEMGFPEDANLLPMDLPEQQASPIYTKIVSDRVVLDEGHPLHSFLRKEGVDETRRYLQKELERLNDILKASNVDRKYLDSFVRLTELIGFKDDAGAISFGLHVQMVSHLTKAAEQELSEVLVVQIGSTLTHSAYFASQYKDWVDFLQSAHSYPSRQLVENDIQEALDNVARTLAEKPESVDPRIPESIRFISSMMRGTSEERVNAIYAGVRGVENICIATIKYAYDEAVRFVQDAGKKARPALVKIGSVVIIGVALTVIYNFMPVIKGAPELRWILENLQTIEKISRLLK